MMKLVRTTAALLFGIILLAPLQAEARGPDWRVLGVNDSFQYFYDPEGIKTVSPGVFRVWLKTYVLSKGVEDGVHRFGPTYRQVHHNLAMFEINCAARKRKILQMATYKSDGSVLGSLDSGRTAEWLYINPETVDDPLLKAICR